MERAQRITPHIESFEKTEPKGEVFQNSQSRSEFSKILLPISADDQAENFLKWLFGKDINDESRTDTLVQRLDKYDSSIPFLATLLDLEIEAYANAKGISKSTPSTQQERSVLRNDLLNFESKYPGLIASLHKSAIIFARPPLQSRGSENRHLTIHSC